MMQSSSEQPPPAEAITYMGRDLFKAAKDGDMEPFNKYDGGLHCLVDGRRNTALHIYSRTGGLHIVKTDIKFLCFQKKRIEREFSPSFVQQLVDKCPSLLLQPNARGEIPLHMAVRHGHCEIVKILIERARVLPFEDVEKGSSLEATSSRLKQMLRMRDKKGNTAFHMAAESGNVDVVELLLKELDADFSFSANTMGESPLYIAARKGDFLVVAKILGSSESIDYVGPDGTTALHAAVTEGAGTITMGRLIEKEKQLTKETDDKGRTPLHYAAHSCGSWVVTELLKADASAAYITDKGRGMSPLHIAAWRGDTGIMKDIISHCPGCCEIVDEKGWNFLHYAFAALSFKEIKRLLLDNGDKIKDLTVGNPAILLIGSGNKIKDLPIRNLLNEKDDNGNTPLHVFIFGPASDKEINLYRVFKEFSFLGFNESFYYRDSDSETKRKQIQEELKDIANEVAEIPLDKYFLHLRQKKEKEMKESISQPKMMEKAREAHLLVATLVTTVAFTAAFTVPGGYKSNKGTAILGGDLAFKFFIIADTLAFISSLLAVFIHFLIVLFSKRHYNIVVRLLRLADWITFVAMVAMVVAFSTGTYAVLKSSLGIAASSICLILFPGPLVLLLLLMLLLMLLLILIGIIIFAVVIFFIIFSYIKDIVCKMYRSNFIGYLRRK